jgi:integrase/recombinase XerD
MTPSAGPLFVMLSATKGDFVVTPLRQRMLEDLQIRNYAASTVRAYVLRVAEFAKHFGKSPDQLGAEHIREYQLFLTKQKRVSQSAYIQTVCGLRFLYTYTLNRQVSIEHIPLPRYEKKLPIILSREEVKALLEAPKNLSHRAILTTMYASGPRVSEVARLKVCDIDSSRNAIWIRGGKGRKDRQTLPPPKLLELLRFYWQWKQSKDWLFPGAKPGQLSPARPSSWLAREPRRRPASPGRSIRTR